MDLYIKKVNKENYDDILKLEVSSSQKNFIESTKICMDEAYEMKDVWRPVGIYNKDNLIGFAMYGLFIYEGNNGRVWLDRYLIDEKYQGLGYGKNGINLLVKQLYKEYNCDEIYLSIYDNNVNAIKLYKSFGFKFNGELDINGEKVMILSKEYIQNILNTTI